MVYVAEKIPRKDGRMGVCNGMWHGLGSTSQALAVTDRVDDFSKVFLSNRNR